MVRETREPIVAPSVADHPEPDQLDEASTAAPRERIASAVVWFVVVAGLFLFIAFGTVELHYGGGHPKLAATNGRVIRIWLDQASRLPRSASLELVKAIYYLLIAIILIGSAVAMWLTLVTKSDPVERLPEAADPRVDVPAEPPAPPAPEAMGEAE